LRWSKWDNCPTRTLCKHSVLCLRGNPARLLENLVKLIKTLGLAALYRDESYFGRTTPVVRWVVKVGTKTVADCTTRREALAWLNTYSTP